MKTLETLEQEAKQAREVAAMALSEVLPYGSGSGIADKLILAAVSMVTYQFALAAQEQKPEVQDDGWIKWNGGNCPVKSSEIIEVKFRFPAMKSDIDLAGVYRWHHADKSGVVDGDPQCDIIAYRIVK